MLCRTPKGWRRTWKARAVDCTDAKVGDSLGVHLVVPVGANGSTRSPAFHVSPGGALYQEFW